MHVNKKLAKNSVIKTDFKLTSHKKRPPTSGDVNGHFSFLPWVRRCVKLKKIRSRSPQENNSTVRGRYLLHSKALQRRKPFLCLPKVEESFQQAFRFYSIQRHKIRLHFLRP